MKKAFTLIEIVFILVILGIVASIGSEIIAKLYENRIIAEATRDVSEKVNLTLEIIAKRLIYRIRNSEVARKSSDFNDVVTLSNRLPNYNVLEWIGIAAEAMRGKFNGSQYVPGYSGFIDIDSNETNKSQIKTPGSHLSYATDILQVLSDRNLSQQNNGIALIWTEGIHQGTPTDNNTTSFSAYNLDYQGKHTNIWTVYKIDETTLGFDKHDPKILYEHYALSWSAYTIYPEKNSDGDYNLTLYYDYRPWLGEKYSDGKKVLLAKDVTNFKFKTKNQVILFTLCARKRVMDFNVTFCGKKVVF